MRKVAFLILLLIFFSASAYAQNFAKTRSKTDEKIIIAKPEKSLNIREKLEYSLEWLGIPVGKIILQVEGIKKVNSNECYHITANAKPNKFFAKFYDVEYEVHTYIDKDNFCTHRFEKTRRTKDKFVNQIIDFDRETRKAKVEVEGQAPDIKFSPARDRIEAAKPTTLKILNGAQDLFSSLYYLRTMDLKENSSYTINIYYDERNWEVKFKVGQPFLKEIRKKGTFPVFEIIMNTELNEFILGKSDLILFLTADRRRIPTEFKLGTGLGTIHGKIRSRINL